tara:strand:+ start:71 stop:478 length:408 start_codon:yes stop_codon:yes gene_type:complete
MKEKFGMYNPLYSKKYQYSVPLKKMDLCAKANGKHNCSSDFLPLQGAGAGFWMSNTDNNNNLLISESPTDNMGKGSEILGANSFGRVGSEIKNGYRLDDNMQVIPRDIENKIVKQCMKASDSNACFKDKLSRFSQ